MISTVMGNVLTQGDCTLARTEAHQCDQPTEGMTIIGSVLSGWIKVTILFWFRCSSPTPTVKSGCCLITASMTCGTSSSITGETGISSGTRIEMFYIRAAKANKKPVLVHKGMVKSLLYQVALRYFDMKQICTDP